MDWSTIYAESISDSKLRERYIDFAESQINYILGDNPQVRNYVVGFSNNPPQNPHHRTRHGAWANSMTIPENQRHVLYVALVSHPHSRLRAEYAYSAISRTPACRQAGGSAKGFRSYFSQF